METMTLEALCVRGILAKRGYISRVVPAHTMVQVAPRDRQPRMGDLAVARVECVGELSHLENPVGRRMQLYPGDVIIGAYGNRYATDFYEGYVGKGREANLLTTGGLLGVVASSHDAYCEPTLLDVLGFLFTSDGHAYTLDDFGLPIPGEAMPSLATIVVLGSGMNAGKTTTVASTIRGLVMAGLRVGAGKVTGSGSGKDRWSCMDAGASAVLDFLDFGMSSTFGYPLERLAQTFVGMRNALAREGVDVVVLEIADGILQTETASLLPLVAQEADSVVFAAVDALSAQAGVALLRDKGVPVRAVSGIVTRSPLATREIEIGLPTLTAAELASGALQLLPVAAR